MLAVMICCATAGKYRSHLLEVRRSRAVEIPLGKYDLKIIQLIQTAD